MKKQSPKQLSYIQVERELIEKLSYCICQNIKLQISVHFMNEKYINSKAHFHVPWANSIKTFKYVHEGFIDLCLANS